MNQVFVCGTYFQIYVSMLLVLYRTDRNAKSLLILNDHTPEIEKIIPALVANGFFDHYLFVPFRKIEEQVKTKKGVVEKILKRNKIVIQAVENNSDITLHNDFIAASEFNLFYVWGYPSAYFVLKYPNNYSRIIEDGTRNYFLKTSRLKLLKRKYLLRTYIGDGFDNAIQEIQVQRPEDLDKRVRHKGTKLLLKEKQHVLSPEDKAKVVNVFMKDHSLVPDNRKKILVVTQPLSEDHFISEAYKVSLYRQLIDEYAGDFLVYLKPHPRELTNYKQKLEHEFIEIPRAFPLEMLDLMEIITFDIGVTLFSSSFDNVACILHKIQLGKSHVKQFLPGKKLV